MPETTPLRSALLRQVADHLLTRTPGHPLRVGVDGVCGVGKSTFADDLAGLLVTSGRPVVRLDSDGFHHRRARRHRNTTCPGRGYYEDAYDFGALEARVLRPLGPGGSREYAVRVHDLDADAVISDETAVAEPEAIVLFDATFLQRDGLRDLWDEVVYLDADLGTATSRGVARDAGALGGREAAESAYAERYRAACHIYLDEQAPRDRASVVVQHDDPAAPRLVRLR